MFDDGGDGPPSTDLDIPASALPCALTLVPTPRPHGTIRCPLCRQNRLSGRDRAFVRPIGLGASSNQGRAAVFGSGDRLPRTRRARRPKVRRGLPFMRMGFSCLDRSAPLDRRAERAHLLPGQTAGWPLSGNGETRREEESPGSTGTRCRVTPGGGDPRESATESKPPALGRQG